ncbi:UMP-CMP kinase [Harpegnathos saltator]|nr:UMP-CMP kinase [Harpegnathos saltator]
MLQVFAVGARRIAMSAVTKKPEVVFILGGPGAGKGTLCRYIVERYGYVHLSAGDLLREERAKPGSQYGELIETHIKNGTIVPVEITCSLLDRAMHISDNPYKRFLIDGFPRNQDNLDGWNKVMADKVILKGVIFCECSQEVCTQRCLNRGAGGSGRSDDNEQSLVLRHQTYLQNTIPIVALYEQQGLVFKVDSMKPPGQVFQDGTEFLSKIGW